MGGKSHLCLFHWTILATVLRGAMGQPASSCAFWFLGEQSECDYSLSEQMLVLRGTIMPGFWSWPWLFWVRGWSWEISVRRQQTARGEKGWFEVPQKWETKSCRQDVWHGRDHWLWNALFHLRQPEPRPKSCSDMLQDALRLLAYIKVGINCASKHPLWSREAPAATCVVS